MESNSQALEEISTSIGKLSTSSLLEILKHFKVETKATSKEELADLFMNVIFKEACSWVKDLKDDVDDIAKELSTTPAAVDKALEAEKSINAALSKLSPELIGKILKTCGLEDDDTGSFKGNVEKVEEEILMQGANKTLKKLEDGNKAVIKSICEDLKIKQDQEKDIVNTIFNTMFEMDNQDQQPEEPPKVPEKTTKKAPAKKPAASTAKAASSKKPAATVTVPKTTTSKKPAATTTTKKVLTPPAATTATNGHTSNRFDDVPVVGERRRTAVLPPPPPPSKKPAAKSTTVSKPTTTKSKKPAPKRKAEEMNGESDNELEDEDEDVVETVESKADKKKGITGRNPGGGYYQDRKYVSPPISLIKKGYTSSNLSDWYNADDLKEFCKLNNLPRNATKSKLIRNIVLFLNGDYKPKQKKISKKARAEQKKKEKEEAIANVAKD